MNVKEIVRNVRENGCVSLEARTMRLLWPPKPTSNLPWDLDAVEQWCLANRLECYVDQVLEVCFFNPRGIDCPIAH